MADAEKSDQKTESMCALLDVTARTRHRNGKLRRDFVLIVVLKKIVSIEHIVGTLPPVNVTPIRKMESLEVPVKV